MLPGLLDDLAAEIAQVLAQLGPIDPAAVAPYLGRYANPALGEVTVALRGDRLLFDAGELWFELRPVAGEEDTYVLYDGPQVLPTDRVIFGDGADVRPTIVLALTQAGEALRYSFEPLTPAATPTP